VNAWGQFVLGYVRRLWKAGRLGTTALLIGSSLVFLTAASALGLEREGWADKRITIELVNTPLREALAKISELVGTPIEVSGLSGDERRISVILRDTTLQKGLERILAAVDYVVIHTSQGTLAILVIDGDPATESDPAREGRDGPSDPSSDQFSTTDDLFPPPEMVRLAREQSLHKNNSAEPNELDLDDPNFFPPDGSESADFTSAGADVPRTFQDAQGLEMDELPPGGEDLRLLLENLGPAQPQETGLAQTQFDQGLFEFPPASQYSYSEPQSPDVEEAFFDSLPPADILDPLFNER